jgi:hypothetical protein
MFLAAGLALGACSALAHPGARVWLNIEDQKVTTYAGAYPPGDPSNYSLSRVFTQPLIDEGGDIWDNDFPGYQMVPGGTIPQGANFSFAVGGPLLWYNAGDATHHPKFQTVASHFGADAPQFNVSNELFQSVQTGSGVVPGYLAFAYNGGAGDHNHLTYTLLGNGTDPEGGPDGIFALPLVFSSSGAASSEPFFLLLGKNASTGNLSDAATLAIKTLLLPGDANGDRLVNFSDFQRLELGFGKTDAYPSDGDFDFNGVVDRDDFKILYDNMGQRLMGQAPPAIGAEGVLADSAAVPEPGALAMMALVFCVGVSRRRLGDRSVR